MFRLNPVVKQVRKSSASLFSVQKRSIAFDADKAFPSDRRPPNMADFRAKILESSKSDLFKHELRGRLNSENPDSLWNQTKASYEQTAPFKFNQQDIKFLDEYFGFGEEEVRIAQDFNEYEKTMFVEFDGEKIPNFDKFKLYWGSGSEPMTASINEFELVYKNAVKRLKRYSATSNRLSQEEIKNRIRSFDFSKYEGKIPTRIIEQVKSQYLALCDRYEPDLDVEEMYTLLVKELERGLEDFVDGLGEMKGFMLNHSTQELVKIGPALLQDAEGNYVNDFESFDFIETFFPEVRDLMLREMSVENYRIEFPWEVKKYALGYEDIVEMFHKHTLNNSRREVDEKSIIVVSSDKNAQEIQRQLQHVSELLDEASTLSREASAKKGDEGGAPEKKAEATTTETDSNAAAVADSGDDIVWKAIEEQAGVDRESIFGGRVSNYEPIDINAMLDAEEREKKN